VYWYWENVLLFIVLFSVSKFIQSDIIQIYL